MNLIYKMSFSYHYLCRTSEIVFPSVADAVQAANTIRNELTDCIKIFFIIPFLFRPAGIPIQRCFAGRSASLAVKLWMRLVQFRFYS